MDETAVIDREAIERLEAWGGPDLLLRMLELFLDHAPQRMDQIRAGANDGPLREAERGAHSLKSSAGNLGVRRLQALAAEVEDRAADGDGEAVEALLGDLESAYHEARSALARVSSALSG